MFKYISHFGGILISTLLFAGACRPVYIPNTANVPLFTEKGELQSAIYVNGFGADAQIAYAASDHIGLMVNGKFENTKSEFGEFRKHSFLEIGVGSFTEVDDIWIMEVYGGVGVGDFQGQYNRIFAPDTVIDVRSIRLFIQPSIGTKFDRIEISMANRIAYVNFNQTKGKDGYAFFLEPLITTKYGFDRLKMVVQAGMSIPFAPEIIDFEHQPFIVSFGIHGRLNLKK